MPNYRRNIPSTPDLRTGVARMYVNSVGDIVVEYASGNIILLDTSAGTGGKNKQIILDGVNSAPTQVNDQDGGDAFGSSGVDIDAGGVFNTL